jgi:hypothetical protein
MRSYDFFHIRRGTADNNCIGSYVAVKPPVSEYTLFIERKEKAAAT